MDKRLKSQKTVEKDGKSSVETQSNKRSKKKTNVENVASKAKHSAVTFENENRLTSRKRQRVEAEQTNGNVAKKTKKSTEDCESQSVLSKQNDRGYNSNEVNETTTQISDSVASDEDEAIDDFQTKGTSAKERNGLIDLSFEDKEENAITSDDYVPVELKETTKNTVNISTKKPARNKHVWTKESDWNDLDAVLDFLEDEGFVLYDYSDLICGQKFYFRCKRTPKSMKPGCAKLYTLYLPSNTNEIQLLNNSRDHNHAELLVGKTQLMSDDMINFVNQLFEKNVTQYSSIKRFIEQARQNESIFLDEPVPNTRQIEYRRKKFRDAEVNPLINLGDLIKWCEDNSIYPSNENDAFVVAHDCSSISDPNMKFRFCLTTPTLLQKFIGLKQICIDATYKLNWNGFPLIILGTVDRAKKFHPLAYACTTSETADDYEFVFESIKTAVEVYFEAKFEPTTIIADGAHAIRNAFFKVFPSADLGIMCFPHVIRNIRKRHFKVKSNKQLILDDIRKIQKAPNRSMFEMMCELFCEKWKRLESEFIEYFRKQWLGDLNNWFEGAAEYTPSTNNGVESHNANIKRKVTLRRRLPLNQFLAAMKHLTETCSEQFSNGKRQIATEPIIKREMMLNAAYMCQSNFKCFKARSRTAGSLVYLVPSSTCEEADANEIHYKRLVERKWTSFDEFIKHGFQKFYVVNISMSSWKNKSTCTCVSFFKENMCKHVLAIGMLHKIIDCPDSSNPVLLNQHKRNAGRVTAAKKALEHQN
ncbi:uncharacterized protein LOC129571717 [Sitodiplosis mosellana]|uniref:uncharacterized protein LOC129571717 n=1 Tax=Sitodiplosis mosellana TaxID=263140 RepID=UPI0024447AB7|nr:uncharacterized protein LOC129571717 [Sitodiplosis mosellana]